MTQTGNDAIYICLYTMYSQGFREHLNLLALEHTNPFSLDTFLKETAQGDESGADTPSIDLNEWTTSVLTW